MKCLMYISLQVVSLSKEEQMGKLAVYRQACLMRMATPRDVKGNLIKCSLNKH